MVCALPDTVFALAGRGDVMAAATNQGVVVWNLVSGDFDVFTMAHGLPSNHVRDLALDAFADEVGVATDVGLARGGLRGPWQAVASMHRDFFVCVARPGGGWIAGGASGQLVAWTHDRFDSLVVPARAAVVGLAFGSPLVPASRTRSAASAPLFGAGLVVATDGDGIWLLQSVGTRTRWLQFESRDGLPSRRVRRIATDGAGCIWAATDGGAARLRGLEVETWPQHPWLSRPVRDLAIGRDGFVYLVQDGGLVRVRADAPEQCSERVTLGSTNAVRVASVGDDVWWSDGSQVVSMRGARLRLPEIPAACRAPRAQPRRTVVLERLGAGAWR